VGADHVGAHGFVFHPLVAELAEQGRAILLIFSDLPDYAIGNFAMEQILLVTETGTELLTPLSDELWIA